MGLGILPLSVLWPRLLETQSVLIYTVTLWAFICSLPLLCLEGLVFIPLTLTIFMSHLLQCSLSLKKEIWGRQSTKFPCYMICHFSHYLAVDLCICPHELKKEFTLMKVEEDNDLWVEQHVKSHLISMFLKQTTVSSFPLGFCPF